MYFEQCFLKNSYVHQLGTASMPAFLADDAYL